MKRLSKRIISSVLTGTMLLSLLGGSALAVEPEGGPEEEVRFGQPVMSDVVSIQAYTEETETGNELKQIEIVYKEGTDLSGLNGESYLLEGRGPQDEEFTEIQIQEVTVDEESALLVVGGFTTNHDISEGTEEGMDLRLRHTWEEEDSALSMSRGEPWLEMKKEQPASEDEQPEDEEEPSGPPQDGEELIQDGEKLTQEGSQPPVSNGLEPLVNSEELTVDDITSIQAYTDETVYGTGLVEVEITYREDATVPEDLTPENYILEDRGTLNPDFGEIKIADVSVNGQTVTLTIDDDTQATEKNDLVYTGDDAGVRERNAFGVYCTGAWYRGVDGTIYYGKSDSGEYKANTTGMGYQARASLELKLRHTDEEEEAALCLADENGEYTSANKWEKTIDRQFGRDGFQDLYDLRINSTAASASDGSKEDYVRGYYYIPEDYDPADGIVFTIQGQGISYWKLPDGSNNAGTGVMYDSATTSWAGNGAIVVNIHDRSSAAAKWGEYDEVYDFVKDDVNVMKYFIEKYDITGPVVLQGNSRGTNASAQIIKALAGAEYPINSDSNRGEGTLDKDEYDFTIDAYICNNGTFGSGYDEADWAAVAATGLKVWAFDGEQDTNNVETIATYSKIMTELKGADWVKENVRLTGYPSEIYSYWGESDHSTTRINGWYFDNDAFYGPDLKIVDGEIEYNKKLSDGDTYTLDCRGKASGSSKDGYEYTVYDDLYQEWALEPVVPADPTDGPTPIEDTEKADASIGSYQRINGYFTYQISVNDSARGADSREIEVYIPEGARQREYWISMALPSGVDSTEFLEKSGWFDIADETLACLLIMKPENGTWGSAEDELAYVDAAMGTLVSSGTYYSAFTYHYLVGYGDGAPALQLWAAQNPLKMISQVYVDAQVDAAYDALLEAAGETQVGKTPQPNHMDFEGYTDKDGSQITQKRTFEAQHYNDIPIPTWFVGNTSESLIAYWKDVNDCLPTADPDSDYGQVYWQDKANSDAIATSFSDVKTQVAVQSESVSDMADPALTENINSFLTYYSGYDNNSVYGHFITQRLPYTNQDTDNVLYRDHMWEGTNRTYIIYIPDSVKSSGSPAPLVVTTHGAGQTAMVFLEATDIKEAADEYGFIAVTYDLTGNADYMLDLLELVKDDCKKAGVTVDEDRIYGYGQSAGGGATANTLAQDPRTVELFAAFGITSGVRTTAQKNGSQLVVPFYAIYGEYDYWPMKLGALEAGEWTGSQGAKQCTWTTDTQTYWAQRLLGKTLDELVATPKVESGITEEQIGSQQAPISLIVNPTEAANRYKNYIWSRDFGGGEVPIFVWSQCYGRGHNLVPSDLNELWENWFSKWERGADDQTLLYYKDGVGHGTPVKVDQTSTGAASDFDSITNLEKDWSQAAQLPLTGWYTKNIDVDGDGDIANDARTVKVYIAPEASIRSYFTVVAVPDDVDTYEFLRDNGWFELANAKGEGLFVLEPGAGGWGSAQDESAYVEAAIAFLKSGNNIHKQNVFSTFGEFYLAGYGKGAAALELWAAANPIFVISQAYVDGTSAGADALTAVASTPYDGKSSNGDITDVLDETLNQVGIGGQIAPKDVPVPTYLAGYTGSENYWQSANDCAATGTGAGVYWQDIASKAYATEYANGQLKEEGAGHGISKVEIAGTGADAQAIYEWLSDYTRYDNTFPYSNAIAQRLDYTSARVAAQQDAKDGQVKSTLSDGTQIWGQEDIKIAGHGTVQAGVIAFSDNSGDGKWDPREYILYIPEGFEGKELPILMLYPGNSQTDSIFMDSTLWWQLAEKEGIALAFVCETYSSSPSSVSHADSDKFYQSLVTLMEEKIDGSYADLDFNRIYGSGQSAGSAATQGFAVTNPEFFAAVGSTSAAAAEKENSAFETIPTMLIAGQMDLGDMPKGFESTSLQNWAKYMLKANGIDKEFTAEDADQHFSADSRHPDVYSWTKTIDGVDVPLVQWALCLLRPHNCYPSDMPVLWDFMEHFSFVKGSDGSLTRYYSPSAFEKNDAVKIDYIPGAVTPDDDDDDDDSSSSSSSRYTVSVGAGSGKGTVSVSPQNASEGTRVTITVTPASGYEVDDVTVTDRDGDDVRVTKQSDTRYTFTMPDSKVEVEVSFVKTGETAQEPDTMTFSDVKAGDWFYDAVLYAYENGLMSGTGAAAFSPNQTLTRAMVAQVLYSMEGAPAGGTSTFTDVAAGTWYASAVNWAAANGVVSGYGDGTFGPNDNVTREQVAMILYSFAKSKGYDVSEKASLSSFADMSSVSTYAQEAMSWAAGAGLISGMGNNTIVPQGSATRAQFAVMLMQFCEEIAK